MIEFLLSVLKTLAGKIVTDEFNATCPSVAQWLVKRSAARLGAHRERYEEQWLADLADRGTPIRKLIFAIGVCRAAVMLRRELVPAVKPVQSDRQRAIAEFRRAWDKAAREWDLPERTETDFPRKALTRLIGAYLRDPRTYAIISVVGVAVSFILAVSRYFSRG